MPNYYRWVRRKLSFFAILLNKIMTALEKIKVEFIILNYLLKLHRFPLKNNKLNIDGSLL